MTSKAFGLAQLGNAYSDGALGSRNRIINGAMVIDQRNAGAAVSLSGLAVTYTLDRWAIRNDADAVVSVQQSSTAPTGFGNSLLYTVTTADASLGSTQNYSVQHRVEGFNVADFGWGSASAQPVTLSFWVRSSLTGTFGGAISNSSVNRSYPFTYSISVADTWEYKTVIIAGDTSGTWLKTNGLGAYIYFSTGAGSTFTGPAGAWAAADYRGATGETSIVGTLNATWQITGVQLEAGDTATPFEHRSYGQELALCQRYAQVFGGDTPYSAITLYAPAISSAAVAFSPIPLAVKMRAIPSAIISGAFRLDDGYASSYAVTSAGINTDTATTSVAVLSVSVASGLTVGRVYQLQANNSTASRLTLSSEL